MLQKRINQKRNRDDKLSENVVGREIIPVYFKHHWRVQDFSEGGGGRTVHGPSLWISRVPHLPLKDIDIFRHGIVREHHLITLKNAFRLHIFITTVTV